MKRIAITFALCLLATATAHAEPIRLYEQANVTLNSAAAVLTGPDGVVLVPMSTDPLPEFAPLPVQFDPAQGRLGGWHGIYWPNAPAGTVYNVEYLLWSPDGTVTRQFGGKVKI